MFLSPCSTNKETAHFLHSTSATSSHDGFLDRELSKIPAVKVDYSLDTDSSTSNSFILSAFDDAEAGAWVGDIEGSLWNRRGWTCQERKLSTRMLHFCKNKLYFECRACLRSEENEPLNDSRQFQLWPRNEDWMQKSTDSVSPDADSMLKGKMYKLWTKGVTEYTQRLLTKDSDKLPAIQSIAAEMSTTISDIYIPSAGMWEGNLQHDLLWQVIDGPTYTPIKYRAPTWSWASLDARILWKELHVHPKKSHSSLSRASFEVLEIADLDFEDTPRAFLKVKACLKPLAFMIECGYEDRWVFGSRGVFPYDIFISTSSPAQPDPPEFSTPPWPLSLTDRDTAIEQGQFTKFAEGHLDLDDKDGLTSSRRTLYYMHIDNACRPSGLILESVEDVDGMWKRVGVAAVFTEWSDLFLEPCFGENEGPVEFTII